MSLSENDIKAELSYAYEHAVAARAGSPAKSPGGTATARGSTPESTSRSGSPPTLCSTDFTAEVQLKATSQEPALWGDHYSLALWLDHYNKLRIVETPNARILVVLFLPPDPTQWLVHSEDGLLAALRRTGSASVAPRTARTRPARPSISRGPTGSRRTACVN